jgi:hypothetical protein
LSPVGHHAGIVVYAVGAVIVPFVAAAFSPATIALRLVSDVESANANVDPAGICTTYVAVVDPDAGVPATGVSCVHTGTCPAGAPGTVDGPGEADDDPLVANIATPTPTAATAASPTIQAKRWLPVPVADFLVTDVDAADAMTFLLRP